MRQFKDINACIALLRAVQARGDIEPEQRKNIENAIEEAKRLRRRSDADRTVAYRSVRIIAESLLRAFIRD